MSATTRDIATDAVENDHAHCLMCGACNPRSLRLCFHADGDRVCTTFQAQPNFQGYTGILHGGVVASLLDSAMTHCLFHHGVQGLTGDLHVRFVQPVPCDAAVDICAWIQSAGGPLYRLRAELRHDQSVMAWAEGKFMQQKGTLCRVLSR